MIQKGYGTAFTIYQKGREACKEGKPYKSNPYKTPKYHLKWALGWMDEKNRKLYK